MRDELLVYEKCFLADNPILKNEAGRERETSSNISIVWDISPTVCLSEELSIWNRKTSGSWLYS